MRKIFIFAGLLGLAVAAHAETLTFTGNLTGDQESTPTGSTGFGDGLLTIDTVTLAYSGYLRWTGLSAAASDSHIHVGVPGTSGSVIYPFGVAGTTTDGIYTRKDFSGTLVDKNPANMGGVSTSGTQTPAQQIQNWFLPGNTYFNVHTSNFPAGEIRGQVEAVPEPATMAALGLGALAVMRRRRAGRN